MTEVTNPPPVPSRRKLLYYALLHYVCFIIMQTMALLAETWRSPSLPDLILDQFSPWREFDWVNNRVWLPLLLFSIILLAIYRRDACLNYLRVGALVSLFRGVFILLTPLGPPGEMAAYVPSAFQNLTIADIDAALLFSQWFPLEGLIGNNQMSAFYLTQDLFFSGHTATTFLLILVLNKKDVFFPFFIFFHINTVFFLFLTHEHYSIDILGAYFVVYAIYTFLEKKNLIYPIRSLKYHTR